MGMLPGPRQFASGATRANGSEAGLRQRTGTPPQLVMLHLPVTQPIVAQGLVGAVELRADLGCHSLDELE